MVSSRIIQKPPAYYQIKTPSLSVLFNEPVLEREKSLLFCPVCWQPYQIASPSDHHYNWNTTTTTTTPQATGQAGPLSGQLSSKSPPKPLLSSHMENLYNRNFATTNDGGKLYFCLDW